MYNVGSNDISAAATHWDLVRGTRVRNLAEAEDVAERSALLYGSVTCISLTKSLYAI